MPTDNKIIIYGIPMCPHCKIADVKLNKVFGGRLIVEKINVDDTIERELQNQGFDLYPVLKYNGTLYRGYHQYLDEFIAMVNSQLADICTHNWRME